MAQGATCRMLCAIEISLKTGEMRLEWADVPAASADAWGQRFARAWDTARQLDTDRGNQETEKGRENHVQV